MLGRELVVRSSANFASLTQEVWDFSENSSVFAPPLVPLVPYYGTKGLKIIKRQDVLTGTQTHFKSNFKKRLHLLRPSS